VFKFALNRRRHWQKGFFFNQNRNTYGMENLHRHLVLVEKPEKLCYLLYSGKELQNPGILSFVYLPSAKKYVFLECGVAASC
jgi:hypothetical protein